MSCDMYRLRDMTSHSQLSFVRQQYCCFQEVAFALYSEATPLGHAVVINEEDTGKFYSDVLCI